MAGTVEDVLRIAAGEVGYSRWSDPERGTKYGRWFARKVGEAYYGSNDVPYCAMFSSWVLDQAKVSCAGFPDAYCPTMLAAAERSGATVPPTQARPGDIVFYDWGGDGETDHVGIVVANHGIHRDDRGQHLHRVRLADQRRRGGAATARVGLRVRHRSAQLWLRWRQ